MMNAKASCSGHQSGIHAAKVPFRLAKVIRMNPLVRFGREVGLSDLGRSVKDM